MTIIVISATEGDPTAEAARATHGPSLLGAAVVRASTSHVVDTPDSVTHLLLET